MKTDKLQESIETIKTKYSTLTPLEINQLPSGNQDSKKPDKIKVILLFVAISAISSLIFSFLIEFGIKINLR